MRIAGKKTINTLTVFAIVTAMSAGLQSCTWFRPHQEPQPVVAPLAEPKAAAPQARAATKPKEVDSAFRYTSGGGGGGNSGGSGGGGWH